MNDLITHATDTDFDAQVLHSSVPVLVDFWGQWCAPCKAIAPLLEDLARDYAGRLKVVKVELDKNQKIAMAYRVRSAPTLLMFKNGQVQATQIGALGKAQITRLIEAAL